MRAAVLYGATTTIGRAAPAPITRSSVSAARHETPANEVESEAEEQ
jgi:hypothetical protein